MKPKLTPDNVITTKSKRKTKIIKFRRFGAVFVFGFFVLSSFRLAVLKRRSSLKLGKNRKIEINRKKKMVRKRRMRKLRESVSPSNPIIAKPIFVGR